MKILALLVPLFFAGCYAPRTTLPKDIFSQVREVEKPQINSLDDIQMSYIKLFEAYQLNLNLLKTLQKIDKK